MKGYFTGKRRYVKKTRKRTFTRAVVAARPSISARQMHMSLPNRQCLTLRANEIVPVTYNAVTDYDAFQYPLYFPGLWKDSAGVPRFAGGFIQLMQLYSKAYVKAVRCHTRMMAVANAANVNINVFTMVASENQANALGSISTQSEFEDGSNTTLAKKHYLSSYSGGHNYAHDFRSVSLIKYTGLPKQNENLIFRAANGQMTSPSAGEAQTYPNFIIGVRNPPGVAVANVEYEFTFDFDIEFLELASLPQLITSIVTPTFARRV